MASQPNPQIMFPGWAAAPDALGTIYVNGVVVVYSPWDFSFIFLRALPAESPPMPPGSEHRFDISSRAVQSVVMSPQHAKAVLKALAQNISEYEALHGEIPDVDADASQTGSSSSADQPKEDRNG